MTGRIALGAVTRMRYNPTLESVNLFVPGLIALVLTLVSALMTAISLSREKERGTLEILLVSPLRPAQIIVGKVVPYLGLAFANVATALLSAWVVFGVPFRGSLLLHLIQCPRREGRRQLRDDVHRFVFRQPLQTVRDVRRMQLLEIVEGNGN